MNHADHLLEGASVEVLNVQAESSVIVVCEHASAHIPKEFKDLGLSTAALQSHVAWDLGARAIAMKMAETMSATFVASRISRLVYDCNRPPDAPDAIPERSEVVDVPGNANLTPTQKADRVAKYYDPFRRALAKIISGKDVPVLVTVHSFTPIYFGTPRNVEIGVLHDKDRRLADAMLDVAGGHTDCDVRRNEPYGPDDGVTHTLREHALPDAHLNVMLEIRNDLIADAQTQTKMARMLSAWVTQAISMVEADACKA
ncbi:Predicted N-formylglutamate amidohydrolase [Cognatiyoonia koreensis]|uniref:Predicted N-formylglutamate amidohydrolase n=1 Tax=Cognatiyoonia koreensis TaxID=364200 RepID=A0A1I0QTX4_9RHOB|nr:N-formylglutamate amidohydrolase [Cognatiyoonia koreensis]SEW31075.1 Predicted N-formylglutamate amidohydrolase [Cognatiyoonia koreensis]